MVIFKLTKNRKFYCNYTFNVKLIKQIKINFKTFLKKLGPVTYALCRGDNDGKKYNKVSLTLTAKLIKSIKLHRANRI